MDTALYARQSLEMTYYLSINIQWKSILDVNI